MENIEIEIDDIGWAVYVGGQCVVASSCRHLCEHTARLLHRARESSHRNAMAILTQDLGMCEQYAWALYLHL